MTRYWTCRKCSYRNERTSSRKCGYCGDPTKPKKRVPKHAIILRDTSYATWEQFSYDLHGRHAELGACAVCGRQPGENRRCDRDHDHRTGLMRGLACTRCNRELLRNSTLEEARAVVAYLERVEAFYSREASRV